MIYDGTAESLIGDEFNGFALDFLSNDYAVKITIPPDWEEINEQQTPNWQNVNDQQTPLY